jgi:hypothetical protein
MAECCKIGRHRLGKRIYGVINFRIDGFLALIRKTWNVKNQAPAVVIDEIPITLWHDIGDDDWYQCWMTRQASSGPSPLD